MLFRSHNIIYWKCDNYLGLGPGASGFIGDTRYSNIEDICEYNKCIMQNIRPVSEEIELTKKDKIEEFIFMGLRMNEGINIDVFKERFDTDFYDIYQEVMDKLIKRELVRFDGKNISLTQKGREISNSVFIEFLN